MPESIIKWLVSAPWDELIIVFLIENLIILMLVVCLGQLCMRWFSSRRVSQLPAPLTRGEIIITMINVILNTGTTLAGLWLWRNGIIHFREDIGLWAVMDIFILLLIMDLLMYLLHRVAHFPIFYQFLHQYHHKYEQVRPLTLFALNPMENLAFGGLWLALICIYPASWMGMSIYLMLNVFFGAVGHLGVEPFPLSWAQNSILKNLAGGTFHVQHHQDLHHNFGFYTLFWDRLFGTIRPDYEQNYGKVADWVQTR